MVQRLVLLICLVAGIHTSKAQMPSGLRLTIERYLENTETNSDFTQIYDELAIWFERPIRLNQITLDELLAFPLLDPGEAIAIINHRNTYGYYLSINELQVVGFSPDLIKAIAPFVVLDLGVVQQMQGLGQKLKVGQGEFISTFKYKSPVVTTGYAGNQLGQNLRLRYSLPGAYSFGFSAEKDAGEAYWNNGLDFYTFHASVQNIGHLKLAVLGDHLLSFGQGLVMGSGIGIGKNANVLNIKKAGPGLKIYRGMNEFLFLRGVATEWRLGKFQLTASAAMNTIDGKTSLDSSLSQEIIGSLDLDGLHRNSSELASKGTISRQMAGIWLGRENKRGNWGLGAVHFRYSAAMAVSDDWYKRFNLTGNEQSFVHAWQGHTLGRVHLFSEAAFLPENKTYAFMTGLLMAMGNNAEISAIYRNYAPGFSSPFSTAFGVSNQNEKGLYAGVKLHLSKKTTLSHYADFWNRPWLSYQLYGFVRNRDLLSQLEYNPTKKSQIYLRYRNQVKAENYPESGVMKSIRYREFHTLRLHVTAPISQQLQLELRGESNMSKVGNEVSKASLFFADLGGQIRRSKTRINLRYTVFNANTYANRIYAFESQLQYDFGTVSFYGQGQSLYLLVNQKIGKLHHFGLRYGITNSIIPDQLTSKVKQSFFLQWKSNL
jgi:hypothetical protein